VEDCAVLLLEYEARGMIEILMHPLYLKIHYYFHVRKDIVWPIVQSKAISLSHGQ
jgi:hypothetical protein